VSNILNWKQGFMLDFDMSTGLSKTAASTKRFLSQMRGMFADDIATERMIEQSDPLVYEFYELGAPEKSGDLAFGTSITYPGKVGKEYFMTKGHFHTIMDTAETYLCLSGHGVMLLENPEGDWSVQELTPGIAAYVPPRYAHRSVNVGDTPFVTFFTFRGDAGHDYGTIETKGYRKLVVEAACKYGIIDNPKWK